MQLDRYDISQSYDWNYQNAPREMPEADVPQMSGPWDFCGLPTGSPLGMPAGPLLNSSWIGYYARLGFDVLTYKTVRSRYRKCYDPPNLLTVDAPQLSGLGDVVRETSGTRSWAISFGMPSKSVGEWTKDVERARQFLGNGQVLSVSVVASPEAGWTQDQIVADFVECGRLARESGAQTVEANLSCPNVCSQEGQLYTSPAASREICAAMHHVLGPVPLILKIGLFENAAQAAQFIDAVAPYTAALSTTNSISARVLHASGETAFDGLTRGIGGECIRDRCNHEIVILSSLVRTHAPRLRLIGVGGIASADDVITRLAAGAHHVQIATAAMQNPRLGLCLRTEISQAALTRIG